MRNIIHYLAIIILLCSTASPAQTLQQVAYELQDGYLSSRAMRVFTGSQADTLFQKVKSQVVQQLNRDSSDLQIAPDSLMWFEKQYESDFELHERIKNVLNTCKEGEMVIGKSNLIALLTDLTTFFNQSQVAAETEETPSLTLLYDSNNTNLKKIDLNLDLRSELHGLLREALGNMRKYARFQYATLSVTFLADDSNQLLLELKDDGIGLPHTLHLAVDELYLNQENHLLYCLNYGLKSFFQTAHKMGGTLTIHSKRDEGTIITLLFSPNSGEQVN
jgi:Histidine kinase-, DNA gyrase B-, and HSP90-like ATPase